MSQASTVTPRLFVALPVPAAIASLLIRLRPPAAAGVRFALPEDLHLTLHFLGPAAAAAVRQQLAAVRAPLFSLRFDSPGHFAMRDGRSILYLGLESAEPLRALHAAIAAALLPLGFSPERRRFVPHVTIARLARGVSQTLVETFEHQQMPPSMPMLSCDRFALYASADATDGGRYRVLEAYPLQ